MQGGKEFKTANVFLSLSIQKRQSSSTIPIKVNERDYKKTEDYSFEEVKEHQGA